jgi:hypothetical protein
MCVWEMGMRYIQLGSLEISPNFTPLWLFIDSSLGNHLGVGLHEDLVVLCACGLRVVPVCQLAVCAW